MVLGLVVIIAVVISSAVDAVSGLAAGGGVVGWLAVRALAQWRDVVRQAKEWFIGVLKGWLAEPAMRWVVGPVLRSPVTKVVAAVLAVAVVGWLVWRSTDSYVWVGMGLVLMAVGLAGQYWWFRGRLREWRAANP